MQVVRAGALYFAIVFALGFALGAVRVTWLVPRLGAPTAEVIELPVMLLGSALIARWRGRRNPTWPPRRQLAVGGVALVLLLAAECTLGVAMQRRNVFEVLFDREPVSGALYYAAVLAFALWPWYWARRAQRAG